MNTILEQLIGKVYRHRVECFILKDDKLCVGIGHGESGKYIAFPGGGVDKNENWEEAVKRETLEEIGIQIKNIEHLNERLIIDWNEIFDGKIPKNIYKGDKFNGMISEFYVAQFDKYNKKIWGKEDDKMKLKIISFETAIEFLKNKLKIDDIDRKSYGLLWEKELKILKQLKNGYNYEHF